MADMVEFELVTPERLMLSRAAAMVVVPGGEGDFGVLPGHAPMISTVRPGVVEIHEGGRVVDRIFVAGGFAEVTAERCTLLAEEAMAVADITREDAEERIAAALATLEASESTEERRDAGRGLDAAEAMLAAFEEAQKQKH